MVVRNDAAEVTIISQSPKIGFRRRVGLLPLKAGVQAMKKSGPSTTQSSGAGNSMLQCQQTKATQLWFR
jgi:hypothetical protein